MKHVAVAVAFTFASSLALAQQTVKVFNVVELSGTGTTAGTNFKNGVELAAKEINAAGGILGRKIVLENADTQSNPAIAKALTTKAIDNEAYVVMGPVFSGSIVVSMLETRRAEVPNFTGGEAAHITTQ
ncbi:MAG TPA: ABC transporter substrate-binding protein, partial [Burkholderiales bacterium]|nr:ABC transporter substrate-binding protein [Burkholderiales bacterium]